MDPGQGRGKRDKTRDKNFTALGYKLFGGHYSFQRSFASPGGARAGRKAKKD